MDDSLRRLERELAESPQDEQRLEAFARACLRAGDPRRALRAARPLGGALHREAALALGELLGLELLATEPTETWRRGGERVALVPGGAFLDEGPHAWRSSLEPGGERAALRRVSLDDFMITLFPTPRATWEEAQACARAEGARLPSFLEWKKAWRGGLFLDGDACPRIPNPEPDRLRPAGLGAGGGLERSPYGVLFPLGDGGREWCADAREWTCLLGEDGRYRAPCGASGAPPLARWVWELGAPREP